MIKLVKPNYAFERSATSSGMRAAGADVRPLLQTCVLSFCSITNS